MNKISVISIAILFMSCAASKKSITHESSLFQRWNLLTLNGDNIITGGHKAIYIEFSDSTGRVSGSGPCNGFFSDFTRSGNGLKLSAIGSTKMACLDQQYNQLEKSFFQTLEKVDAYKIDGGDLLLLSGGMIVATFAPGKSVPEDMVGKWEMFYITGSEIAFDELYPERKPTLTFTAGTDQVGGFSSCNAMGARYIGKKGEPLFKPGAMTLMACPGDGEHVFLDAFQKAKDYSVTGDTLIFYHNAIPIMKFKRTDEQS